MTDPLGAAGAMAQAQVRALVQNASALGLTWTLRPATISDVANGITAIFDGDSAPIDMTSMVGAMMVGQRVWVLIIPPSGNYIAGTIDSGWIAPTLLNGWTNFGSGFQAARYRRLPSGQVEIQGLVRAGTGPPQDIFTLPANYCPTSRLVFSTIANNAVARLDVVAATRMVRWEAGGTNAFLSLNCVFTPAD